MIELAVARHLATAGLLTLDENGTGGNTFIGAKPSNPNQLVMLKLTGGMNLSDQGDGYDEPTLQIWTRGEPHERDWPRQKIKGIYEALVGLHKITLDPGGTAETYVVRVLALQSAPADLGRDANERWEFSQNFAFHIRSETPNRN